MANTIVPLDFRTAASRISAAINIVTTNGTGGLAGFTASAVCSLSDTPAMLLVCLQKRSSAYEAVMDNSAVCINTVGAQCMDLCRLFSGKTPMASRFEGLDWNVSVTGSPVLSNAIVSFDCTVVESKSVETHDILMCKVEDIIYGNTGQHALVYYNREFRELA